MTLLNPSLTNLPPRVRAATTIRDNAVQSLLSQGFEITSKSPVDRELNIIMRVVLKNHTRNETALITVTEPNPDSAFPLDVAVTIHMHAAFIPPTTPPVF